MKEKKASDAQLSLRGGPYMLAYAENMIGMSISRVMFDHDVQTLRVHDACCTNPAYSISSDAVIMSRLSPVETSPEWCAE